MFEDVDGDETIKEAVDKIEGLLAVADNSLDAGENASNIGSHVFAKFVGVIILFLFWS